MHAVTVHVKCLLNYATQIDSDGRAYLNREHTRGPHQESGNNRAVSKSSSQAITAMIDHTWAFTRGQVQVATPIYPWMTSMPFADRGAASATDKSNLKGHFFESILNTWYCTQAQVPSKSASAKWAGLLPTGEIFACSPTPTDPLQNLSASLYYLLAGLERPRLERKNRSYLLL